MKWESIGEVGVWQRVEADIILLLFMLHQVCEGGWSHQMHYFCDEGWSKTMKSYVT